MSALVQMLRKQLMTVWLWQGLFVLAVIGGFVSHHLTVQEMMKRIRFVAMDSRDTFYLANLGNFETAQHIHAELAKMAAETIFSRNPDGYDSPERLLSVGSNRLSGEVRVNIVRKLLFYVLNTADHRTILNRWRSEGRIPESYCGSLQEISPAVEDEYRQENHKPWPEPVEELYDS